MISQRVVGLRCWLQSATVATLTFLKDLRKTTHIGMVGGSDLHKQREQLGDDGLCAFGCSALMPAHRRCCSTGSTTLLSLRAPNRSAGHVRLRVPRKRADGVQGGQADRANGSCNSGQSVSSMGARLGAARTAFGTARSGASSAAAPSPAHACDKTLVHASSQVPGAVACCSLACCSPSRSSSARGA